MAHCEIVELHPRTAAVVTGSVPFDGLTDFFATAFTSVMTAVVDQGLTITGPPFAHYPTTPSELVEVSAGFPVEGRLSPVDEVRPLTLAGGEAVVALHVGPYDDLERTYLEVLSWASENGVTLAEGMWEEYLNGPGEEPDPARWKTRVVWPLVAG